jgi:hypothetical protein
MVPGFESEHLETIYEVATSFNSTKYNIFKEATAIDPSMSWHGSIAWSFKRDEISYGKYINPWLRTTHGLWVVNKRQPQKPTEEMELWEYFFYVTTTCHNATLETLQSRFIVWALPRALEILERLTAYVSPDVYAEMLERVKQ